MKRLTDKRLAIPPGQWQEVTDEQRMELKEIPVPSMYTIPETGFTVVPEEKYKRILMDEKPSVEKVYNRLKKIEDILGDEYNLDRLRELAEADREGRCVVLPRLEPGQGDPPGELGPQGLPGEVVFCKDCDYIEYSDCYGECGRGYLGIVKPYDYCSRGMRRDKEADT